MHACAIVACDRFGHEGRGFAVGMGHVVNDIFIFLVCVLFVYLLIQKDYVNFIKFTDNKKIQIKFLEKLR